MGETAQVKGKQDGKEAENGRTDLEDQRLPREEEGSVLQTGETQGRRHVEGGLGKLEELLQRLESGNMGDLAIIGDHSSLSSLKCIQGRGIR